MKLYTYDPAPNPKRLQLFINYKGIDIETEQVDLMKLEQFKDEFRAVNPVATVPTLVTDEGVVLAEVIGACVYLEEKFPDKPLLGTTALEKAQVISWDHQIFNTCLTAVAEILRNGNPNFAGRALPGGLDIPQIPELVERGKLRLAPAFRAIDAALADSPFLVGDSVTLADIDLLVCTEFCGWVKESVPEDCANIHAWLPRAREALGL
ncbi:glutathione S-transferase family protein [Parahaliea maris]|uniref:Glutathione S-transferase family protein n=1 Tax=Parahaliea maris TaxID=2716870 RepID=A0A5C9A3L8_9GAMM|nr:glutathione S-transferase family protein [Parahaliea maris]TXS94217.1 glutathione S-transferase family protein [Parahaliea maris]